MKKDNILWAPWRYKYINDSEDMDCIFCHKPKKDNDEKELIIYRGDKVFALLNKYPYNNGHIMVAPYKHTGNLEELTKKEYGEMTEVVKMYVGKIKETMNPHGFNVGMNIGKVAGAGFDQHLHMHIVPRWEGDTNFMPVVGEERVISESLNSVYNKLKISKT
ncbi:MAG: HIT family protein [Elusimicrobiota bacterium]